MLGLNFPVRSAKHTFLTREKKKCEKHDRNIIQFVVLVNIERTVPSSLRYDGEML